ncbi:MAG: hybrid-cluster NAD(P)-dependent oxidoreductase [Ornithinimicrobium sp.]
MTAITQLGASALHASDLFAQPMLTVLPSSEHDFDLILRCKAVVPLTHDVSTFVLEPMSERSFSFAPGQYVVVTINVEGERHQRCYTISSPPTRPHLLTITVKRTPGGLVSNWLHDHLERGGRLEVAGPFGEFTLAHHPARTYLFLSAGSGVTPLMSMTRTLSDLCAPADVAFIHSARSPQDIVFRHELQALPTSGLNLSVTSICEADSPGEVWTGPRGRLSAGLLGALVPDVAEREVFMCGPTPYMDAAMAVLAELGVPVEQIHQESFVIEPVAVPLSVVPDMHEALAGDAGALISPATAIATARATGTATATATATATVTFAHSGHEVQVAPGTTVLEAATSAGICIRSSCGQGLCVTCKSDLLEGSVDMQHAGGIRPREIASGKFLPCCSYPQGNLVINA